MTSDPRKLFVGLAVMALMLPGARAATLILKPETVQSWDDYIEGANARFQERLAQGNHFLWMDEAPDRAAKVKENGIIAAPAGQHIPMKVPSGLIHDWIAVAYMPNLTIRDVLAGGSRLRTVQGVLPPQRDRFEGDRSGARIRRFERPVFDRVNEQVLLQEDCVGQRL
jgi:hypothetical protein